MKVHGRKKRKEGGKKGGREEKKEGEGEREKGERNVCLFCFVVGMIKYLTRANYREHRFPGMKSVVAIGGFAQRSIKQLLAHILTH